MKAKWFSMTLIVVMLAMAVVPLAGAAPKSDPGVMPGDEGGPQNVKRNGDSLSHPKGEEQAALKAKGLEAKLLGKAPGNSAEVARGQYVQLGVQDTDRIFVILAEFGDTVTGTYGGDPGPQHNEIAEPDRNVDNTTIWQADYDVAHYEDMYFNQMLDYYQKQSSGRYAFNGSVTEWVRVPYNEARYGSNWCGDNVCYTTWFLIRDAINIWTADRLADGWTLGEINDYLSTFDVWDRYDHDGDNDFDEPDGYIDHFQIVHAGVGEETGGGAQGTDAIWSHRWYTAYQGIGVWGPPSAPFGGMEFGGAGSWGEAGGPNASGIWVGDYTIQPENGGLGVFAHEYAHDLGLPDAYNTSGAGDNGTGFWTIMSSGSYLGDGTVDLGSRPGDFSAWEKFQLGWLKYDVASAGLKSAHKLGPAETTTKQAQGLFVVLPDKEVTEDIGTPTSGSYLYYSGAGNDVDSSMTRSFTLPAAPVTLTAEVNYEIELDWDYAYLLVNGSPVNTSESTASNPNGQNFGFGITGSSGGWTTLTADLSAFAGQTVDISFRYWTDGFVVEQGILIDDIQVTGSAVDDAESDFGWAFDGGFRVSTGSETGFYFNAYVAEFRQYRDYDTGLQTGPYNFGFLNTLPDWVEHFPYADGLLISYWDTSFTDNNTSDHPGGGLILPIDSHPTALLNPNNDVWRARIQVYDAPFTLGPTDPITLHLNGASVSHPSLPGVSVFNDLNSYWDPAAPLSSVIVPNVGVTIRIKNYSALGNFLQVVVNQ